MIRDLERVKISRLIWHGRHYCESSPPFTNCEYIIKGMKFHLARKLHKESHQKHSQHIKQGQDNTLFLEIALSNC